MSKISGAVFWITGASSGIGEAMAYLAAEKGAKLVISARRKSELDRVKQGTGLKEEDILVLPMDLENLAEIPKAAEQVVKKFGRIDILFNNAGIAQRGTVADTDIEVFERITKLNYISVIALTKAVLPIMQKQQSGHIITTSSVLGMLGVPLRSGYAGSKHALHGFFDSMRPEVSKDNIKVTLAVPGYVKTNVSLNALTASGEKYNVMDQNQEKGITPEHCAKKILKGIERNKKEIYVGGIEILGIYVKRFFPALADRLTRNETPK